MEADPAEPETTEPDATEPETSDPETTNPETSDPGSTEGGSTVTGTATATTALNVRSGPGTSYSVISVLSTGESVTTTGDDQNGWTPITYKGQDAWVSTQYLSTSGSVDEQEEPSSGETETAYTTTDVNLRTGPGLDYRIVRVLSPNTEVELTGAHVDRNVLGAQEEELDLVHRVDDRQILGIGAATVSGLGQDVGGRLTQCALVRNGDAQEAVGRCAGHSLPYTSSRVRPRLIIRTCVQYRS